MGAQARFAKVQAVVLLGVLAARGAQGAVAKKASDIEMHADYHFVSDPVSTEKISVLDPQELNPHRARWVLNRKIEIQGLETIERRGKTPEERGYGVRLRVLDSVTRGYTRAPGPWYRPMSEYPCRAPSANDQFATEEGARQGVDRAAKIWDEIISSERVALSLALTRVVGKTRQLATLRGLTAYDTWMRKVEAEWRSRVEEEARVAEWNFYKQAAKDQGLCTAGESKTAVTLPWESLMEAPGSVPPEKPLYRAPARRWNGMYSIRLNIGVAGQVLTGQFLIDTGAAANVLAPGLLDAQGIPLSWVEQREAGPQRVSWSGGTGLAYRGVVDRTTMGSFDLGFEEYLLFDVDFFHPPRNLASCCDGILGTDFLRKFVVEFHAGPPTEIRLWPKTDFRAPGDASWTEVHILPTGELVSDCIARSEADPFGSHGVQPLVGARWDTGSDFPLDVNTPWKPQLKTGGRSWAIECGPQIIAKGVPASVPSEEADNRGVTSGLYSRKYPAVSIGMPVMGRGSTIFDLPHGRIWFLKDGLSKPIAKNTSGLDLDFISKKGERILRVQEVRPQSKASALLKSGLKPGTEIIAMDGKPAEDLDLWETEQRLSGAYGPSVLLEWMDGKEKKSATLTLR